MTMIGVVSTFLVVYFLAKYSKEYFEKSKLEKGQSNYGKESKELLNKIVFLVWSDEFDEKEYAYRWCISGRNKGNSN